METHETTRVVDSGDTSVHVRQLAGTMALAIVVGAVVGGGVVLVDQQWLSPPPFQLGSIESGRSLLSAIAGGLITVAVFSLWMRTVVVGLVSDHFSPRTLTAFLEDRFQRHLLAAMIAGLVAVLVILMTLPEEESYLYTPVLGTVVAVLIAVAGLAGVLAAIQHATRSLSLSRLVSQLADEALEVLERQPEGTVELLETPPASETQDIRADAPGWVVDIDTQQILAQLPPGAVAHLCTRVGAFVTPHTTILSVALVDADEQPEAEALRSTITLARTRSPHIDLGFALGQLLDVGVHALEGTTDTATGHEVMVHLGAVLEAVVERGVPLRHDLDTEGRQVYDEAGWDAADFVQLCIERMRAAATVHPESTRHLLHLLGTIRSVAELVGDRTVVSEVGRQVEMVLGLAEQQGFLERDQARLQREADAVLGSPGADTGGR